MKRALLVLLAGLASGTFAHLAWFSAQRPPRGESREAPLAWMQTTLDLSPGQFARIQELHAAASPHRRALAAQVDRMRGELAAFEHERTTAGEIDFLEFARFVEQRRAVDRDCAEATRRLVFAAGEVMTAPQRARYLALVGPALRPAGRDALN